MKLVTFEQRPGTSHPGVLDGDSVVDLSDQVESLMALIQAGDAGLEAARQALDDRAARRVPLAEVRLLAPLARPGKIICLAGNYAEHVKEGGGQVTPKEETTPFMFMKPTTTVVAPEQPVILPKRLSDQIDWECELGVVIGRAAKEVSASEALSHVFGYTVFNDISARSIKHGPNYKASERSAFFDWLHGKWFDTFGPMGPCIVTADEIPDPQALSLELRLNGQTRQKASTGDMIYSVAELIEFMTGFFTLEPGDFISTGTPSGVGAASGTFLKAGDVLEAEIEGIGVLRTPIAAPQ